MTQDAPDPPAQAATPTAAETPVSELRLESRDKRPRRTSLWLAGAGGLALAGVVALILVGRSPVSPGPGDQTLSIQVAERSQAAAPDLPPTAPLEVLPKDMAQAAPHSPPLIPETPLETAATSASEYLGPSSDTMSLQPASLAFSPSFDCRQARTHAERVVCADPVLAEADQRLASAYSQALAAGVPGWRLERQQRRWLRAREDAAHAAPAAVAEVYAVRIAELEDMADIFAPEEGPPWPASW